MDAATRNSAEVSTSETIYGHLAFLLYSSRTLNELDQVAVLSTPSLSATKSQAGRSMRIISASSGLAPQPATTATLSNTRVYWLSINPGFTAGAVLRPECRCFPLRQWGRASGACRSVTKNRIDRYYCSLVFPHRKAGFGKAQVS